MSTYLSDLIPYKDVSFAVFMSRHYEIERLLELLVITAVDLVLHVLVARGEPAPLSYRAAFLRAGEIGIISEGLSRELALGAGLRNVLVHEYEEIDYEVLHRSIPTAVRSFASFMEEISGIAENLSIRKQSD